MKKKFAIYRKLSPIYVAAIVDKNYFDGEEVISTFLVKEETRNTELKMYVENNAKNIPLLKIVFLELKKHNENLKNDYKKIRWLDFFGNKHYTNQPDDILIQADNLLNLRNWSEEEKRMYDEVTRQQDYFQALLAYAQEEGMSLGIECGKEQEQNTLVSLIKDGYNSPKVASEKLNISIDELYKYL